MTEPVKIQLQNKNYFAWQYEGQTHIKHRVFESYWKIWVTKLGKYYDTLFVDCHGGCGAYVDEHGVVYYGSSILADKVATNVNSKNGRQHKNLICVCEKNEEYFLNLKKVWDEQGSGKNYKIKNGDFNDIIKEPRLKNYYTTHPTLFLVDPFGYNLNMTNLQGVMTAKGSEIIVNFMFDHINRFLPVAAMDQQRDEYFGSTEWRRALSKCGHERELFLVNLYKENLKRITGAKFCFAYRLSYPERNQTYYYLIHVTKDIEGITHMKNSFAGVTGGRVEYVGKRQNEMSLFELTSYKTDDLARTVLRPFAGKTMNFNSVWEKIVENVPYVEKDLSEAIHQLENEGKLSVKRITTTRNAYRGYDEITFGANL